MNCLFSWIMKFEFTCISWTYFWRRISINLFVIIWFEICLYLFDLKPNYHRMFFLMQHFHIFSSREAVEKFLPLFQYSKVELHCCLSQVLILKLWQNVPCYKIFVDIQHLERIIQRIFVIYNKSEWPGSIFTF